MPHLAPLYWTFFPFLILALVYMISMSTYFNQPTSFNTPNPSPTQPIKWKW